MAARRLEDRRRRQRLGRRHDRHQAGHGVRRHRLGVVRLLRCQPAGRQLVRQQCAGPRCAHRHVCVALSGAQARPVGSRSPRRTSAGNHYTRWPENRCRRADHENGTHVAVRAREGHTAVSCGRTRHARHRARRRQARDFAVLSHHAGAVCAPAAHAQRSHQSHAGRTGLGAHDLHRVQDGTSVRCAQHARHHRVSRRGRRRRVGRAGL